jgi:hypothetical protein
MYTGDGQAKIPVSHNFRLKFSILSDANIGSEYNDTRMDTYWAFREAYVR